MDAKSEQFWQDVDEKIEDIIYLIRLKYPKFNGTPIEKVICSLWDAYKASGKVCDSIDKGWIE